MKTYLHHWLLSAIVAAFCAIPASAFAQNTEPAKEVPTPAVEAPAVETPDVESPAANDEGENDDNWDPAPWNERDRHPARWNRHGNGSNHGNDLVSVGSDSNLAKGAEADTVVSVLGSSTSAGNVSDAVVSVVGDTRVEGGTVSGSAVSVLGDTYVNAKVTGDVVATLGNVELGPEADVGGDVVIVGGKLKRDAAAIVHGGVQNVLAMDFGGGHGLRPWIKNCLMLGRPLAFAPGLGWLWTLALGFLALYTLVALLFRDAVDHCVHTLETHPGQSVAAALLTMLLTPVLFVLLCITVIGIAFIPFALFAMFLAGLFGKVVVYAWIGRRCTSFLGEESRIQTAAAVLIGGAVVYVLYVVPFVGFIVYNIVGILGFGAVIYTLIQVIKARRTDAGLPPAGVAAAAAGAGTSEAGAAPFADFGTVGAGASAHDATGASGFTTGAEGMTSGASAGTADSAGGAGAGGAAGAGFSGGPTAPGPSGAIPATAYPRAGFWVRMLSLLIDAILIGVLLSVLHNSKQMELIALATYGAIMWKLKGTTIGGIVCGLQVVRVDGRPIDWPTAIVRALGCFLSMIFAGLGFIWIAFDDGKQGWHDKIAGTAVVRVPKGVSLL
ncbi:MAG TPA: RDD family protein [Steroidobacteraceae bacterium]|nr:RDD family protein [Steroidobacteraceae bacterium]